MSGRKKTFVTLFPYFKDHVGFYGDTGQIPYRFGKLGYKSKIISYKNEDEYKTTKNYLEIKFLNSSRFARKFNLSIVFYLIFNAKKIDILNVFHIKWESLLFASIYKIFNRKGFVYLKLDNCHYIGVYPWEKIFDPSKEPVKFLYQPEPSMKWRIKCLLIRKLFVNAVNLWSVEDSDSCDYYSKEYPFFKNNLIVSYNGHTIDLEKSLNLKSFTEKDDIILSVGRLGTYQKATEILLESFAKIYGKNNWTLHLAGGIESDFKPFIEELFKKYSDLESRIIFHGYLNKKELFELYNRAKIFCLPSRYEGFAIVSSESMYFKNAIITTPYVSPKEIIKDKMGLLVERDDVDGLADAMHYLIEHPGKIKEYGEKAHKFAVEELNWDKIIVKTYNKMKQKK